jgi:hypothetical protein
MKRLLVKASSDVLTVKDQSMKSYRKEIWFSVPTRRAFINWRVTDHARGKD